MNTDMGWDSENDGEFITAAEPNVNAFNPLIVAPVLGCADPDACDRCRPYPDLSRHCETDEPDTVNVDVSDASNQAMSRPFTPPSSGVHGDAPAPGPMTGIGQAVVAVTHVTRSELPDELIVCPDPLCTTTENFFGTTPNADATEINGALVVTLFCNTGTVPAYRKQVGEPIVIV